MEALATSGFEWRQVYPRTAVFIFEEFPATVLSMALQRAAQKQTRCCLEAAERSCSEVQHAVYSMGYCGLMDKASVCGTKDCRFESCQDHLL